MSGWKSWSIGEVVEAGDFQDLVQDQVVQTYADAATRTSTLGTAVTEGMMAFTADDDNLAVYANNNWNTVSQAISPNYVINSAFDIWQRGTSFTLANAFFADRWIRYTASGAAAITREAFSAGEIEAIGFGDATFYQKMNFTTGANFQGTAQRVEDVKTLSGQTVTVSFWAKGTNPGTGVINVYLDQDFGSGGSSRVRNLSTSITITSDWQRYTVTGTLGSMTGKTIGANNYLEVTFRQTGVSSDPWELNLWGVQLEAGSVATPFRRNANSIQGELAACQRYFYALAPTVNHVEGVAYASSTTNIRAGVFLPTSMRSNPTLVTDMRFIGQGAALTPSSYSSTEISANRVFFNATVTGSVLDQVYVGRVPTAGNLTLSAEL